MSENREEILANFQSITAIDDVSEAIFHLEESDWSLHLAIQRVMPLDPLPPPPPPIDSVDVLPNINTDNLIYNGFPPIDVDDVVMVPSSSSKTSVGAGGSGGGGSTNFLKNFGEGPSSSSSLSTDKFLDDLAFTVENQIEFIIHFKSNMYRITISEYSTLGELKTRIQEVTLIPSSRQFLNGWKTNKKDLLNDDSTILKSLDVSKENDILLSEKLGDGELDMDLANIDQPNEYNLHIKMLDENKTIQLKFRGDDTLSSIKQSVYSITSVAVRHQVWTGWPSNITANTTLDQSGIGSTHNLTLKINEELKRSEACAIDIDSDSDQEFEDASELNNDEEFVVEQPKPNRCFLIPDHVESEIQGSELFVHNYIQRYTDKPHPDFYIGSLEEAYKEACLKPAKDRKLLAIYLHHDESVLANVFCSQLLGCETILQTLSHNFVLYGWDLTFESNKNLLLSSISGCISPSVAMNVRNIPVDKLPTILIIHKFRSTCDILSAIDGNVSVDELLTQLIETVDMFMEQQKSEIKDENERAAREQIKFEQDMAFRESLEADRAKEEAKRQTELRLANEKKQIETEQAEREAIFEAKKLAAAITLPPEPVQQAGVELTKIRITKPGGESFERRFTADTKLQILLNFVISNGFFLENFKLLVFPRIDLTTLNPDDTLKSLKLHPQVTVRLEQR